ncbi:signal recognition particle protein, partial [bacterium]|nr:signal recognition particle protein [bacterium]
EEAKKMQEKMKKAEFTFDDFLSMQRQMKMFGSIDQILGMLPGMNIKKEDRELISHEGEKQLKRIEVFIQSMTPEERSNPLLLNSSRKKRIAAGSGIPLHDINIYIKQFDQMRSMMKGMNQMKGMFGKMGGLGMQKMMQNMMKFK